MKKNIEKNQKEIIFNKSNLKVILIITLFGLVFFSLVSGVNAKTFDESSSLSDIQNFIKNEVDDKLIFNSGNYANLQNLNITRALNISSNGQVNIKGNGGTLFNVNANNVIISNLNISGYQTAIKSNNNKISIIGNNITTTGASIDCTGSGSIEILLENNNLFSSISGYYSGVVTINSPSSSKVNITMKGNNITATGNGDYSTAVFIRDPSNWNTAIPSDVTITLENNNLKGTGYASLHIVSSYNKNNITLINNNIIGTGKSGDYAAHITISSGTSTVTLTKNNIKGISATALKIEGNYGKNTLIFKDNNFSATGSTNDGVNFNTQQYFYDAEEGPYNNISFHNNIITAEYGFGIFMASSYMKNTLNFTKNYISGVGKERYGIGIDAKNSNNNFYFANNTIFGEERGLDLSVKDSNNTITVINNIITGRDVVGFNLHICDSTNNKIHVIGNKFFSDLYAMSIFNGGWQAAKGGLLIANNTFESKSIGLNFFLTAALSDVNITGNHFIAGKEGIGFNGGYKVSTALNVNYNRIIAPIGLNFTNAIDGGSNFDYNWWGVNDISSKILGFTTNNHYILSITNLTSLDNVTVGDKVKFALLVLNTTMTNEGVENLPYFVINGTFNGEEFISTWDDGFIHEFTITQEGSQLILDHLDEQDMEFSFEGFARPDNGTDNGTDIENPGNGTDKEDPDKGTDKEDPDKGVDKEDPDKGTDKDSDEERPAGPGDKKPIPEGDEEEEDENPKKENNLLKKGLANMKPTGVPIAILLIIAISSLMVLRRKDS